MGHLAPSKNRGYVPMGQLDPSGGAPVPDEPAWLADAPDVSHQYADFSPRDQRRLAPSAEHSPDPWSDVAPAADENATGVVI